MLRVGEMVFPRKHHINLLSNNKQSSLKHTNNITQTEQSYLEIHIFLNTDIHIYIYSCNHN